MTNTQYTENLCLDCGGVFYNPKLRVEPHGEERWGCPVCGGEYVEAQRCDLCGEVCRDDYIITKNVKTICEKCFVKLNANDPYNEVYK